MRWKELFFTGFYSGYLPVVPGTAGTLLALLVYVFEFDIFGAACRIFNLIVVLVMLYPSVKLGDAGEKFFNKKDPGEVVLDEMMGYWISVLFFPFNWNIVVLAFIIFRIIDIFKPYPIRRSERYNGGFGIMIDDFIAGIYTNLLIRIIIIFAGLVDIHI